jgi:hypothetical protein
MRDLCHGASDGGGGLQFGQHTFGVAGCSCHLGCTNIGGFVEGRCTRQSSRICQPG